MIEVLRFRLPDGTAPFDEWVASLRDRQVRARILARIVQLESGNFGDNAPVGEGVSELRIHLGAGYRIYYGRRGDVMVLLLGGGDKSTQQADIDMAKRHWRSWKGRQRW